MEEKEAERNAFICKYSFVYCELRDRTGVDAGEGEELRKMKITLTCNIHFRNQTGRNGDRMKEGKIYYRNDAEHIRCNKHMDYEHICNSQRKKDSVM